MEHCTRGPKLAESIVEIWEAILHTLLINATCRGFQFCILALEPMDAFVHAFKCQRHCGDGAGAFRDNMQGGMRLLTTFVPAYAHAFQALCPGVRSITQLTDLNFQGLVIFTDGGMETANGDTTAGCAQPGPILSRFYVCDVRATGHFPCSPSFCWSLSAY